MFKGRLIISAEFEHGAAVVRLVEALRELSDAHDGSEGWLLTGGVGVEITEASEAWDGSANLLSLDPGARSAPPPSFDNR